MSEVARVGVAVNIGLTLALGLIWWLYYRNTSGSGDFDQRRKAPVVSGITLDEQSSLSLLAKTSQIIAEHSARATVDAISLVRELLQTGFSLGASDLHLTPEPGGLRFTYRVDGILHDAGSVARRHVSYVINRVKVMATLSLHVHQQPQDGRFTFDREQFQARVSTLPTNHGEKIVIRLAVNDETRYQLDGIGFDEETLDTFKALLLSDHGVIYMTGPTGSGKTTTMYAAMSHIRDHLGDKLNLVTLEDPMEVDFRGMAQTQVNNKVGLTFAAGLRSVLRQDPDVIMVGEIRDVETAVTAIRAGVTGHLLLTTVHADSVVGVFHRLKQLEVDAFQLASASLAVVNQRLAVRNCDECLEEVELTTTQARQLALLDIETEGTFYQGKGCEACRHKGLRGRVPFLEVLRVSDAIREMLVVNTPKSKIIDHAVSEGMITLREQAMRKVHDGILRVDEALRILSL
ncbi:MAG: GspE/PulE family protein [Myxococcota bacterium]